MIIEGLEINSPEYWEIRHQREDWPRTSGWVLPILEEEIQAGADVLVVGCGQGAVEPELLRLRPDINSILGIDLSPTAIEKAKALNAGEPKISHRVVDVFEARQKIEFESLDFIISIQDFDHWKVEDHTTIFRNLWSRLRVGGRFFMTGVGRRWGLETMNYSPMEYNGKTIQAPNDYHYCNWDEQQMYNLFNTQKHHSARFWRLRRANRCIGMAYNGPTVRIGPAPDPPQS